MLRGRRGFAFHLLRVLRRCAFRHSFVAASASPALREIVFDRVAKGTSSPPSTTSDRKSRRELGRCEGYTSLLPGYCNIQNK
ncbi:hypothetical protein M5K25_021570 [Dendrobium thyrsiflorum]|uniref:Secreted protein n=1 Tax=Dendrobium thyrsiflorum TaxID=117978 RepID=A0ABD0UK18_DENTH